MVFKRTDEDQPALLELECPPGTGISKFAFKSL